MPLAPSTQWVLYALPTTLSIAGMVSKNVRWLMVTGHGPPRIEQGGAPSVQLCPTDLILETLAWPKKVPCCVAFFSSPWATKSQDHFAFTWEGQKCTFQVLPQGCCMSWDGNPRPVPLLLFHIRKMGPLHQ